MRQRRKPTIALLTDFGERDVYAGVMRGVLAARAPTARVVDLSHEVPAGDVPAAALLLWHAHAYFPEGTVFLAVVDPGVGTARRPIAVRLPNGIGVGPDNGVFSYLLSADSPPRAVAISVPRLHPSSASATFHGRDIFAPAAARLAQGASLSDLGPPATDLVTLPGPRLEVQSGHASGEVLWIDGFGNAVTSIGRLRSHGSSMDLTPCWRPGPSVTFPLSSARVASGQGERLPVSRTYSDVPVGEPLAYVGSSGLLEIAVRGGRADQALRLASGIPVTLVFEA